MLKLSGRKEMRSVLCSHFSDLAPYFVPFAWGIHMRDQDEFANQMSMTFMCNVVVISSILVFLNDCSIQIQFFPNCAREVASASVSRIVLLHDVRGGEQFARHFNRFSFLILVIIGNTRACGNGQTLFWPRISGSGMNRFFVNVFPAECVPSGGPLFNLAASMFCSNKKSELVFVFQHTPLNLLDSKSGFGT